MLDSSVWKRSRRLTELINVSIDNRVSTMVPNSLVFLGDNHRLEAHVGVPCISKQIFSLARDSVGCCVLAFSSGS
jgi:hypothetical protein